MRSCARQYLHRGGAQRGSPGRNRTSVASPDSKSGGPCQQTNRGTPGPPDRPRVVPGAGHNGGVNTPATSAAGPPRARMTGPQRREQLLDVGRRIFAAKGFEASTVEEIAAKAGVSKPVVYEHFGGKEGLYAVVVDREIRALSEGVTAALSSGGSPRSLVEHAAMALLDFVESSTDGFRILVRDSPAGPVDRVVREPAQRLRRAGRAHSCRRVQEPPARPQDGTHLRTHARRDDCADRAMVGRPAPVQEGGGRRPPGQPVVERPAGAGRQTSAATWS